MTSKLKNLKGKIMLFAVAWFFGMIMAILSMVILTMISQGNAKRERKEIIDRYYSNYNLSFAKHIACSKIDSNYYEEDKFDGKEVEASEYKYQIIDNESNKIVAGEKNHKLKSDSVYTFFKLQDERSQSTSYIKKGAIQSKNKIEEIIAEEPPLMYNTKDLSKEELKSGKYEIQDDYEDKNTDINVYENEDTEAIREAKYEDYKYYTIIVKYNGDYSEFKKCKLKMVFLDFTQKYMALIILCEIFSVTAFLLAFIALMCVSGRREEKGLYPGYLHNVPFELLFIGLLFICGILTEAIRDVEYKYRWVIAAIDVGLVGMMLLGISMSFATRIKDKSLIRDSVFGYAYRCLKRINKYLSEKIGREIGEVSNPFIILFFVIIYGVVAIVSGICFIGYRNVYVWFFGNIVIFSILIKLLVDILYIREGIHKISSGETSYKLNSRNMMPIFKAGVDDINNIADGIEMAVNEKTKSERMKTELITNVSHDIKTPLTSIINYADLIKKQLEIVDEENKNTNNRNIDSGIRNKTICNESEIKDYCEVLGRQSIKLKRLIEDLVEASKASTGNLEIKLAPCEASVFMTQIVGEYREKFEEVKLDLVAEDLENNIKIMADGRRMLRVFDNIMNNICKYSLAGTRVYLQLEENNGNAVFIFKNISREPLNLSPEELMERFVRGDKSRSTEGNGLGLSIAKSMTELQGGTMKLEIDGDLFKVNLIFPLIREEQFLQKELLEE